MFKAQSELSKSFCWLDAGENSGCVTLVVALLNAQD